ncbi:MRN complex-interacting protein [Halichoeres trimaculatus]|uniref:MRN complex-interacting protein n=1 Tax=Halichoeres trimaculatus TaxID=147232 RepID=UPI003D9F685C
MVQEFHVLRCFSCQSYQVQQVKKVNKWSCKMCGEKQTLLKEFGRGSGADCRRHVQKLNSMRGAMMEEQEHHTLSRWEQAEEEEQTAPEGEHQVGQPQVSRWSKYLDAPEKDEEETEDEQNVLMERNQLHGNHMIDRKRKRDGGGGDRCSPEQQKPGLMMPPKTTRTTFFHPASLTQARTTNPNPTSVFQARSTNPNRASLTQTRTPISKPTSLSQTRTTNPNPASLTQTRSTIPNLSSPEETCPNWSRSPSSGVSTSSRWAFFLSSDSQGEVGEGPSDSVSTAVSNDVITQPQAFAKPRPLLPVSSMFESGDEFSFDDFL